jgi:hypothetical protein
LVKLKPSLASISMFGVATSLPKAPTSENPISSPIIRSIFGLLSGVAADVGAAVVSGLDVALVSDSSAAHPAMSSASSEEVTIRHLIYFLPDYLGCLHC